MKPITKPSAAQLGNSFGLLWSVVCLVTIVISAAPLVSLALNLFAHAPAA